jgi:enoyl-CoA hydratase/carnithine racemase
MSASVKGQSPSLDIDGRVAVITLRRPEVANRLEFSDLQAIRDYVREIDAMAEVLVLCLRGEGKYFCSGFNVNSIATANVGAAFEALAGELENARPVTIASINGGVYGGATDLALACDFRIGVSHSQMAVPAAKLGLLFYEGGLHRYVSRLGVNVAKGVLLTGATFDAQQMMACGFLTHLVEAEQLSHTVQTLSRDLAGMAPLALLGMKRHLTRIAAGTFDMGEYRADVARADASDDLREGSIAWQEKRAPQFKGR